MSDKDIVVSSRENYEDALERAEKAEAESRVLSIELETCKQHSTTLREVGDQMLKDYQQTTLTLERERKAAAEMRHAVEQFLAMQFGRRTGLVDIDVHVIDAKAMLRQALSSDSGRDYFHRNEFKPLIETAKALVVKMPIDCQQQADWAASLKSALDELRSKGIIS